MIKRITKRFTPKQYLAELLLGLAALLGLYLIVAWSSYTPLDNSWSTASFQTETINKAGALGAWMIDTFFIFLGYIGHLIPFIKNKSCSCYFCDSHFIAFFWIYYFHHWFNDDGDIVAFKYELLLSWRCIGW